MPSVSYDFVPGQMVYVIDNGTIKSGSVVRVEAVVNSLSTVVTYWVNINGQPLAFTGDVYENCKAVGGYQQVVFTGTLNAADIAIAAGSPLVGSTLEASIVVDGGAPVALSLLVAGGETFQDVLDNLNATLTGVAVATLVDNNIRVTSLSTGTLSTVVITDGGTGSPVPVPYFANLNTFTGLAASVAGLGSGALEALGTQVC